MASRAGSSEGALDAVIGQVAHWLWRILPNLRSFDLRNQILNLPLNDPPTDVMLPNLIAYGIAYACSGYVLALWLFHRKEL